MLSRPDWWGEDVRDGFTGEGGQMCPQFVETNVTKLIFAIRHIQLSYPFTCWASGLLLRLLLLWGCSGPDPVSASSAGYIKHSLARNCCAASQQGSSRPPLWKQICFPWAKSWNTTLNMKPGDTQIHSFIHSLIDLLIHAFTYSFLYYLFIHSVIHLYIYLSMFYFWQNWFPHVQQLNSCERCHFNVTTLSW